MNKQNVNYGAYPEQAYLVEEIMNYGAYPQQAYLVDEIMNSRISTCLRENKLYLIL
jgi:hypothetical protein